jgi:nucleotide-binding universal stress UspA family protein
MTDVMNPMARLLRQEVARGARESPIRDRPVLLATDGSPAALAAARIAAELADTRGAVPHAVRATDTTRVAIPVPVGALLSVADALVGPSVHEPDVRAVRAELASLVGRPVDWPVHVALGAPAGAITRTAAEIGAALVVMGIRRHRALDRVVHDETTLNVIRTAACPVLGVTSALTALPRCAVVGVDFGPASARAARAALDVLDDGGTLVLVHVAPAWHDDESPEEGEDVVYAPGVEAAFDRLVTDLMAPADVTVKRRQVEGGAGRHVAEELFAVADAHRADLIAVGSGRHGWLDRALHGSVATDLARDGRHSLLVAPPPPPTPPHPLDVLEP